MNAAKRSAAPHTTVPLPNVPIKEWIAPHDEKEYGETDEAIYRRFFKEGHIRVEIKMVDKDGAIGRKVYYIKDPNQIKGSYQSVIVTEQDWQEYLNRCE